MKLPGTNTIEYYAIYLGSLIILYFSLLLLTFFLQKSKESLPSNGKKAISSKSEESDKLSARENSLKWKFLTVSTVIKAATWIKAPYIFALYNRVHRLSRDEIGVLYAVDNLAALLSGPFFGSMCDSYGRKKFCMIFCVFVIVHISFRITGIYELAYLAQVLSGFSGALMETAFESWVIFEANSLYDLNTKEGSEQKNDFLRMIFTKQTNVDCLCSIFLTALATYIYINWGILYPFYICMGLSLVAFILIAVWWDENKSEKLEKGQEKIGLFKNFSLSFNTLCEDKALLSVGIIESLFKVSLNLFLFIWTPLLEETAGDQIHPGAIFACFMLARLIGSELFESVKHVFTINTYFILLIVTFTGSISFFVDFYSYNFSLRLFMFVYFDGISGIFSPLMSSLKSQMIPEKYRTTIMNFFRMPINIFSIVILLINKLVTTHQICLIAFGFMLLSTILNAFLLFLYSPPDKEKTISKQSSSDSICKACCIAMNNRRH